jgi:hypothetical protein
MSTSFTYLFEPEVWKRLSRSRTSRLYSELGFALSRLGRDALKGWSTRSASRLLMLAGRRVGGLAKLATVLGRVGFGELMGVLTASRQRQLSTHIGNRTAAAIDGTISLSRDGTRLIAGVSRALMRDPKGTAPAVLGGLLGFSAGAGGLDGNGGIPDLDLLAGIGAHRSPLTHTIVAGIIAEGLLLALADLAAEVHGKLPHDHDSLWDELARIGRPLTESLAIGTSAGLAYHLLVDALIQPAALHGLPVHIPMEGHQTVIAASGLAEGVNAAGHAGRREEVEIVQGGPPEMSPGRRAVNAFGDTANVATTAVGNGLRSAGEAFRSWRRRQ